MASSNRIVRRWGWTWSPTNLEDARYPDPTLGNAPPPPDPAAVNCAAYADPLPPDSLRSNGQTWYTTEQELAWAPGNRGSVPTTDDLAPLWPEQPGQERSLAVTWWQPDTENLVPLTGLGTAPTVDDFAPLWQEQPGQEASLAPRWYEPEEDWLGGAYPEEVLSEWAAFLAPEHELAFARSSFAPDDDTMPWAAILAAPAFDPTTLPAELEQELEPPAPAIDASHLEASAEPALKPLGAAPTVTGVWGNGLFNKFTITFTWPAGLGPNDYAITYYADGGGWTQNANIYPDDYRNPSPGVDTTSPGANMVNPLQIMVRMVRARASFPDPAFGVDPVMAIGDPVPTEAYGYASAIVLVPVLRPAVYATDELVALPFVVVDPSAVDSFVPFVPAAPAFDPATLPFGADLDLPAATQLLELSEGVFVPVPLPSAPVLPQHLEQELPAARWTVDPHLAHDAGFTPLPAAPTFPLVSDPDLPTAGWTVDPHLAAAEGFVPITPVTTPIVLVSDPELPATPWTLEPHVYEAFGIPPFAPTTATTAQLAALWPDASPQQDRSTQPVWIPDESADGPLYTGVLTPPFNPVGIVPLLFDHEPPASSWGVLPEHALEGTLQSWLHLTWGPPPAGTGSAPAVLLDAESGDPFLYLGGVFIARAG